MSFVFGMLIAIVVFNSASKVEMGGEEYDIIKDFFTGNSKVPVADKTRLQERAFVKFLRLGKGLFIDLEGNLLYGKK